MPEPPAEISCETCVAACCRAPNFMQLTEVEFKRHSKKMDLLQIRPPASFTQRVRLGDEKRLQFDDPAAAAEAVISVPAENGLYFLRTDCGNLDQDHRCTIYSERPACCRNYKLGSTACLQARRAAGLDADRPISQDVANDDRGDLLVQRFFSGMEGQAPRPAAPEPVEQPNLFLLAQLRTSVSRETRWLLEQLAACKASDWTKKTRCAGWNVNALAAHLVTCVQTANEIARAAIDHRSASWARDFKGDRYAVVRAFTTAADDVCTTLDRMSLDDLERKVAVDDEGFMTPAYILEQLVMELAVHGADLAAALGKERQLQPDAMTAIAHLLPDFLDAATKPPAEAAYVLRSSAFELHFAWDGKGWVPNAGPDPCVIEGSAEAVLLYALGRTRFDPTVLETNRTDDARAFKRYLVGP
jgi:uncharacterized protein (TIGR03083 family)